MSEDPSAASGKKALLKSSTGMALATFSSRVLGLVRVRLEASVLGGGYAASVWMLAFAVSNLLRRVLGEGALSTALIPLLAENEQNDGRERVRRQLAVIFMVLGGVLAVIVSATVIISLVILKYSPSWDVAYWKQPHVRDALRLLPLLAPYGLFICLTGVISAVLNYTKMFVRPALAALLLNIALLIGFSFAWIKAMPEEQFLPLLALIVSGCGVLQLLLVGILLFKRGMFPEFRGCLRELEILTKLCKLAAPGVLAYSVLQLSFLIDRGMAASLGGQAVPALNFVDRIIDIPIGIVAVSFGSVLITMMSRSAAEGDNKAIADTLAYSLRIVWFITLPFAALVVFFHTTMLQLLCLGGRYTESDLNAAHYVAIFYSVGIPFFCSLKVILPAFYARKKMKTVFVVSVSATLTNIVLNYILMQYFAQGGIALATVIASLVNNGVLLLLLKRDKMTGRSGEVLVSFLRSVALAFLAAWGIFELYRKFFESWAIQCWQNTLWILLGIGSTFFIAYFCGALLLRSPEAREIVSLLKRRKR